MSKSSASDRRGQRRVARPSALRRNARYRDQFFSDPAAVEDDYRRLRGD